MAWAKIDDRFFSHPKVRRAGRDAALLYLAGLTYCNEHLTDGFIPEDALPLLGIMAWVDDVKQSASKLVDVCLWHASSKSEASGYTVHDYFDHNATREQVEATREARAEAGRRGGKASVASKASKTPSKTQANAKQTSSNIPYPSPTHPVTTPNGVAAAAAPPTVAEQHPAVKVFVDNGGRLPGGKLADGTLKADRARAYIADHVADTQESLALWGKVVAAYCMQWSPASYTVMVQDYYCNNRIPGQPTKKGNTNGRSTGYGLAGIAERDRARAPAAPDNSGIDWDADAPLPTGNV